MLTAILRISFTSRLIFIGSVLLVLGQRSILAGISGKGIPSGPVKILSPVSFLDGKSLPDMRFRRGQDSVLVSGRSLCKESRMVVLIMKSLDCPLCIQFLKDLRPYRTFFEQKGIRFILLSPGPVGRSLIEGLGAEVLEPLNSFSIYPLQT